MSKAMAGASGASGGKSPLAEFMDSGRQIIKKAGGVNDTSLQALTKLASRLELTREELEAAGEPLGLSRSKVREIATEAGLVSDSGGNTGKILLVASLILLVLGGIAGGLTLLVMNQSAGNNQQIAANQQQQDNTDQQQNNNGQDQQNNNDKQEPKKQDEEIPGGGTNNPPQQPPPANPEPVDNKPKQQNPNPPVNKNLDEKIAAALDAAARRFPNDQQIFDQLRSASDAGRVQAWQQLGTRLRDLTSRPDESDPIRHLLAVAYARENNEDSARAINKGLLDLLPPVLPRVPNAVSDYDTAFWALHTAVDAARHPDTSADRSENLMKGLDKALVTRLDRGMELAALQKHCGNVLAQRFYTSLNKSVASEPARCQKLRDGLVAWAKIYFDEDLLQDFNEEFQTNLKNASSTPVVSNPPTPDSGNKKEPNPPPKATVPGDPRIAQLREMSIPFLTRNRQPDLKPQEALQNAVDLAHLSTLAVALLQKETGKFDTLAQKKPQLPEVVVQPMKPKDPPVGTVDPGIGVIEPNPGQVQPQPAPGQQPNQPPFPQQQDPPGQVQPQPFPALPPQGQPVPPQLPGPRPGQPPLGRPGFQPPGGRGGVQPSQQPPGGNEDQVQIQPAQGGQTQPPFPGQNPNQPPQGGFGFGAGQPNPQPPQQGGFQGQPAGFQGQPAGFLGQQGGFQGQPGNFQGGAVGFQGGAGFQGQPGQQQGGFQFGAGFLGQPAQNVGGFAGQPGQNVGGFAGQPGQNGGGFAGQPNPISEQPKMPSFTNKEVTDLAIRAIAQNRSTNDRVAAVTFLAKNCEEKELPTHQAETLASYILSIKNPQEAEVVYPMMGDLARFRSVPLALADLMEESSIIPSHMERLLSNMLRQEVKLGRDATWRKKARATLVSMALPRADSIPPGDAAQEFLVGSYQEQSKLLGFESVGKTRQPSQVLEWMIQSLASKLARQQWPRDTKRYVDRINDEILAVRFVAVDDMHRTVLLQRVWVKLLCLHVAKLAPTQAQEVNSICDNLDISLRQQHDVLGQLATTEEAIFRLWLVLLTAPETTASR